MDSPTAEVDDSARSTSMPLSELPPGSDLEQVTLADNTWRLHEEYANRDAMGPLLQDDSRENHHDGMTTDALRGNHESTI